VTALFSAAIAYVAVPHAMERTFQPLMSMNGCGYICASPLVLILPHE